MPTPRKVKATKDLEGPEWTDAVRKVAQDVTSGLGGIFTATGGFVVAPGFHDAEPITNGTHTAVAWEYSGTHTGDFQGIMPTHLPVVIRGVTIVFEAPKHAPLYHRYVDWSDVMGQLGLSTTGRPALDALPTDGPASPR